MAYDAELSDRVYRALAGREGVSEREMFGGVAYLLHGNMCVGVHGDELIVRLGSALGPKALEEPHTRPFDLTGRAMKGWLLVAAEGVRSDEQLEGWVDRAVGFVSTLPPK
jgi:TfoX/Sxy family transcriptional regulator of competence genes